MGFFKQDDMQDKVLFPGCRANMVHTDNMTISHVRLDAGAVVPEHSHEHEQISNVIEGRFQFAINGETMVMGPGDSGVMPSHAVHSGKALTDCYIIDIFYPVRQDYKN